MKILVTGGAGFIGSHLCETLLARGDEVVALDNFDRFYDRAVKESNLAGARRHPAFRLIEGDIRQATDLDRACTAFRPEAVVHLAALAGVRPSVLEPERFADVNLAGTTQVLEALRRHGIGRLVFASSSSVYGNNEKVPFAEDDPVDYPISPYAATKRAGELLAHSYHHIFGLAVNCLRFFTVYGPRQRPDLAIHKFARLLAAGRPLPVFGDGTTSRDYTFIDDIIAGVVAALDRPRGFRIYNLGESQTVTLRELIDRLAAGLGVTPQLEHQPPQPGDVERTFADISRARTELDYRPRVKIADGIPRFLEWFKQKPNTGG